MALHTDTIPDTIEVLVASGVGGAIGGFISHRFFRYKERQQYDEWLDKHNPPEE